MLTKTNFLSTTFTHESNPLADEILVQQSQAGDQKAMEVLYTRYKRRVYGIVLRMVGGPDADELVQDVFVRVFRGLHSFRGDSQFSTWVYRLAMNTTFSFLAKRRPVTEEVSDDLVSYSHQPDFGLRTRLQKALVALPEGYRAVLVLHDVMGFDHEECAKVLGCRVGTSKSQLHKARNRMREILGPSFSQELL